MIFKPYSQYQGSLKNKSLIGTRADNKITWATNTTIPPPLTFNHEGII